MSQNSVPLFAVVLRNLRVRAGWTQVRLEREARLSKGAVSRLEKGDQTIDRFLLDRLARVLAVGDGEVERAIIAFGEFPAPAPVQESPADLPSRDRQTIEAVSSRFSRRVRKKAQDRTGLRLNARRWRAERAAAGEAWQRLRKVPSDDRRALVETVESYQTWAVVERLCEESVRAASNDVEEAHKLAQLARCAAVHGKGSQAARRWLEGYALAFEANALQVEGAFGRSEMVFSDSNALLSAEAPVEPMDQTRPINMHAVLLRYRGRYDASLALLEVALSIARTPMQKLRALFNMAGVLKRRFQFAEALEALDGARRYAESIGDARVRWAITFNQAAYLCEAGDSATAEARLVDLQADALELGRSLDIVRLRWLNAKVAVSAGRLEEASSILQEVWEIFADRKLWFDAALAVLELARIELERGRTREVKGLANASAHVFTAQRFPEEVLASARLFWDAARLEAASATAAQQLLQDFRSARGAEVEAT